MLRPTSPAAWLLVRSQLQELGVKLISQQELLFAQEAGVPVIDIRPPPEWEAGHIEGSVNVPLYRLITGALTDSARLCLLFTGEDTAVQLTHPCLAVRPTHLCSAVRPAHLCSAVQPAHLCVWAPGWDARKFLRRAGFAFFGVLNGTELNPAFHEEVAAAADKDKGAVLLCAPHPACYGAAVVHGSACGVCRLAPFLACQEPLGKRHSHQCAFRQHGRDDG